MDGLCSSFYVHAVVRKQKNLKWVYKCMEDRDCKLDFIKDLNIDIFKSLVYRRKQKYFVIFLS